MVGRCVCVCDKEEIKKRKLNFPFFFSHERMKDGLDKEDISYVPKDKIVNMLLGINLKSVSLFAQRRPSATKAQHGWMIAGNILHGKLCERYFRNLK